MLTKFIPGYSIGYVQVQSINYIVSQIIHSNSIQFFFPWWAWLLNLEVYTMDEDVGYGIDGSGDVDW